MLKSILLKEENEVFKQYYIESTEEIILQLSQINIFIGANNSGKSRLMREIFKGFCNSKFRSSYGMRPIEDNNISYSIIDKLKINELIEQSYSELSLQSHEESTEEILSHIKSIIDKVCETFSKEHITEHGVSKIIDILIKIKNNIPITKTKSFLPDLDEYYISALEDKLIDRITINSFIESLLFKLTDLLPTNENQLRTLFIPPFRSLNKYGKCSYVENEALPFAKKTFLGFEYFVSNPLIDRVTYDYFPEEFSSVFTGEDLFERIKKLRDSIKEERKKLEDFQEFLGENFFQNKKIEICPIESEDGVKDIHITIGTDNEYPISNLGDGIQSIIILTFPLFEHRGVDNYLFIDEPELFLHPGMQRVFVETLKKFPLTQVFLSTHSNHFLDLTFENDNDISVYTVLKNSKADGKSFELTNLTSPSNNLLDMLGVKNSSVFLSNCTIWVEGISDRIYFREYLKHFQLQHENYAQFKEDIHYSFVEYGGGNITHWSFLNDTDEATPNINYSRLNNRILLITDKDSGKEHRQEELKVSLGNNYYCLECLEVENLLSPDVLKKTLTTYKRSNVPEVKFKKEFCEDDYKSKPIGEFIYEIVDTSEILKVASISDNGATGKIYDKVKFAKNAIKEIENWSDMSVEAQNLAEIIYEFIRKNNLNQS